MPQRAPICALRAAARRTSDSGCSGWPTVSTEDHKTDGPKTMGRIDTAILSGLPIPQTCQRLRNFAQLVGHATPKASDGQGGRTQPTAGGGNAHLDVQARGALDGYCTPASRDHKDSPGMATTGTNPDGSTRSRMDQLPRQAAQAMDSGTHGNPSTSATEKRGALNPAFSAWLMGYPPEWCDCAVTVTPSSRKSRRNS